MGFVEVNLGRFEASGPSVSLRYKVTSVSPQPRLHTNYNTGNSNITREPSFDHILVRIYFPSAKATFPVFPISSLGNTVETQSFRSL